MNTPKVDIPFVRKVLEFVENEHSDFKHEQGTFVMTREIAEKSGGHVYMQGLEESQFFDQLFGKDCKTAACIAGTACLLDPDTEIDENGGPMVNGQEVNWTYRAAELLGLSKDRADSLFWEMDEAKAIDKLRAHLEELEKAEALA